LYEGGIRVPFLAQWKGKLPSGRAYDPPVSSLDIAATALAAAKVTPDKARLDGVDLTPYLTGANPSRPHEMLFWRYGANYALRQGDLKLVRQDGPRGTSAKPQLFDLGVDPGEANDLAGERPEIVGQLQAGWDKLNGEMVAPLWGR
jgi:arylsulfatase A-like enzyme